jgi:hypothetical protein
VLAAHECLELMTDTEQITILYIRREVKISIFKKMSTLSTSGVVKQNLGSIDLWGSRGA